MSLYYTHMTVSSWSNCSSLMTLMSFTLLIIESNSILGLFCSSCWTLSALSVAERSLSVSTCIDRASSSVVLSDSMSSSGMLLRLLSTNLFDTWMGHSRLMLSMSGLSHVFVVSFGLPGHLKKSTWFGSFKISEISWCQLKDNQVAKYSDCTVKVYVSGNSQTKVWLYSSI